MTDSIKGIVAYPVTPFNSSGAVNVEMLHAVLDRLIEADVDAIAPLGSTGETAYLTDQEWNTVATESLKHTGGRVPTVVGVSALTTGEAVQRAQTAEKLGATAVMALPTSYWRLTDEEVHLHFTTLAESIDLPVMLYNNPATTGIDMAPEFLFDLVNTVDNITMVKESSGDITRMQRLHDLSNGTLPYFNGSNPLAQQAFDAGAAGWCTAAPCLAPRSIVRFYQAVTSRSSQQARLLFEQLRPLLDMIVSRGLPTTIKSGLYSLGLDVGPPRRPLLPLNETETARLHELITTCEARV